MHHRNLYTQVVLAACALATFSLLFWWQPATGARVPSGTGARGPIGPVSDALKNMPADMKIHHDRYDNNLTALYEQWLAGALDCGMRNAECGGVSSAFRIPHSAFSPLFGLDVRMSNAGFAGSQNEFQIDINPNNSQFAIGTSNDGRTAGVGVYRSTNGGATWTAQDAPIGQSACCDPAVAYAYDGAVYVGVLDTSPAGQYTIRSTDNGGTWSAPTFASLPDRNNLAVDNGPTSPRLGHVYLTYSDLTTGSNRIKGYRSSNNGATWGTSFNIGRTVPLSGGYQQSSQPRVASDGTLYVGYQYYETGNQAQAYNMLARSTDGGSSFINYTITTGLIVQAGIPNSRMYFCTQTSGGTSQSFRHRGHPIISVSPNDPNTVYAVWTDGRFESGGYTCPSIPGQTGVHSDIVFSKSTSGGASWTSPTKLNGDAAQGFDQFYPWIDVAPDGTMWVGWQDRRDDPANILMKWYTAFSTNGGSTWTETVVADVQSRPSTFIGDYHGLAAENDRVLGMWWDSRNTTSGDPYTDPHVPAVGATATPTPTNTLTRTLTPTNTPTSTPTSTNTPTNTPTPILLVGHVTWQGPPAQPDALQQLPVTLTLKSGATEVNYPTQNTDQYGFFTVTVNGLPNGTYDWRAKGPTYLANSGTVTLSAEYQSLSTQHSALSTQVEIGLMRVGDANNDNCVGIADFNMLVGAFGTSVGDPAYDARADFNGDGTVGLSDFNLLRGNFGLCGTTPLILAHK